MRRRRVNADNNYFTSRDRKGNECNVLVRIKSAKIPANCLVLTANEFIIPDDVEMITNLAFSNCPKMTEIHIAPSVKMISESVFKKCTDRYPKK